jgi:outer membrane protein OmpA-like peptidoglycan-associated protein
LFKRFSGSEIVGYDVKRFDAYELQTSSFKNYNGGTRKREYAQPPLRVEGAVTRIWYEAAGDATSTELARNYLNELKAQGFEILYDSGNDPGAARWTGFLATFAGDGRRTNRSYFVFAANDPKYAHSISAKLDRPEGPIYVSVITTQWDADDRTFKSKRGAYASVDIIETATMKQDMVVVSAGDMSKAITASGRVALYGIFFATDRADILPTSKAALDEIGKLLKSEPSLKLRVVGHSDSAGALPANLVLSKRRADAVVTALTKDYGIEAKRLTSHGVASLSPASTNATDEGRAKNRRVELVPW